MWKTVPTNPQYEVNESGEVRYSHNKRQIKPSLNKHNGYLYVYGKVDGRQRSFLVHRLVAHAFIPNPDDLPQINHKDERKTNNCVENLEWCTNEYNNSYGTVRERQGKAHRRPVVCMKDGEEIARYDSIGLAAKAMNVDITAISYAARGAGRKSCGYEWRYAERW